MRSELIWLHIVVNVQLCIISAIVTGTTKGNPTALVLHKVKHPGKSRIIIEIVAG